MNERKLILILGGARSGKSTFAEKLARSYADEVLFVATAEEGDEEMAARIARHRAERPVQWRTLEESRAVAQALAETAPAPAVLLDCVTLWVTNLLLQPEANWELAERELDALLTWYRAHSAILIVVSNEVGLGLVPADAVSRTFREWLGWFNQRLAAAADEVYFMVAGLPMEVKRLTEDERRTRRRGDAVTRRWGDTEKG